MWGHTGKKTVQRGVARQARTAGTAQLNEGALHRALKEGHVQVTGESFANLF